MGMYRVSKPCVCVCVFRACVLRCSKSAAPIEVASVSLMNLGGAAATGNEGQRYYCVSALVARARLPLQRVDLFVCVCARCRYLAWPVGAEEAASGR